MRALITGATGFVGRKLVAMLDRPVVLSRDAQKAKQTLGDVTSFAWDPIAAVPPAQAFEGVDVVFHLAGDPVAEGRWTAAKKQRIRDSRVIGTRNLVDGIAMATHKPPVLVSASAVGFYGSRGDVELDETAQPGNDFLAEVCVAWEKESQRAESFGVRVVNPRIGIVLGRDGGALKQMLTPFRLGVGGRLGSGKQWMPWVHLDDLLGLFLHAATHGEVRGAMNAVAPNPVINREFTRVLAAVLHRPAIFPVPELALRLLLGGFTEVLMGSQHVIPRVAQQTGYSFRYAQLREALESIVRGA